MADTCGHLVKDQLANLGTNLGREEEEEIRTDLANFGVNSISRNNYFQRLYLIVKHGGSIHGSVSGDEHRTYGVVQLHLKLKSPEEIPVGDGFLVL
ncbi:hypothetical protein ACMD2_10315 [Ananas comosus]|uniref:Uncharacterized protein n=1 Tax=Ananas comosus TaxID=4615 RepID=A0A199UDG3_ANACO|nr:hypothetical protein ACMD2_10315 [Ananas comosus]